MANPAILERLLKQYQTEGDDQTMSIVKHQVNVQAKKGKELKGKQWPIFVLVEQGKTVFVEVLFEQNIVLGTTKLYCQEISETTALQIVTKLHEDRDCSSAKD